MSHFEEFGKFMAMDADEREAHITDLLADVAEVWLDDEAESILIRGLISSTRVLMDEASEYAKFIEAGNEHANQYIGGLFQSAYRQAASNFATLSAVTDVKKQFQSKKKPE